MIEYLQLIVSEHAFYYAATSCSSHPQLLNQAKVSHDELCVTRLNGHHLFPFHHPVIKMVYFIITKTASSVSNCIYTEQWSSHTQ